jgi:POT family proton-dependent oligopeptide transporter
MSSVTAASEKQWLGHPRGLATLFFTEMWERFSYYGMRAILLLYIVAPVAKGGLGFADERGTSIYGWYTAGVYAMSVPGGWLADKVFGLYRSVLYGGIIIAIGHFCLAFRSTEMFYIGLSLIVLGTGLLKPNISGIVGTLYEKDDARRDAGFSVFYMGINLGAVLAPLACGYLAQKVAWHYGFAAAGVGMTFGVVQYVLGKRYLEQGLERHAREERKEVTVEGAQQASFTPGEWRRIGVIFILFVFATMFWSAFEQAGSSLTLFADRLTDCHILGYEFPSTWFQSAQPAFVAFGLAVFFAWLWTRLGKHEPSAPAKFAFGLVFVGLGFLLLVPAARIAQTHGVRVSPWWLIGLYALHSCGEMCLSPVGLSTVTRLAPPRIVGLMLGVWFLSISLGNKIGGWTAGFFNSFPLPKLFGAVAGTTIAAGLVLLVLSPAIKRMMRPDELLPSTH